MVHFPLPIVHPCFITAISGGQCDPCRAPVFGQPVPQRCAAKNGGFSVPSSFGTGVSEGKPSSKDIGKLYFGCLLITFILWFFYLYLVNECK